MRRRLVAVICILLLFVRSNQPLLLGAIMLLAMAFAVSVLAGTLRSTLTRHWSSLQLDGGRIGSMRRRGPVRRLNPCRGVADRLISERVRQGAGATALLALLVVGGAGLAVDDNGLPRAAAAGARSGNAAPAVSAETQYVQSGPDSAAGMSSFAFAPPQIIVKALLTDITGTITPGGPSVQVDITTPGQNALLTFSGTAGGKVSAQLSQRTIASLTVAINKPDGGLLCYAIVPRDGEFLDGCALPVTGTYTLVVDPGGTNTGSVTVTAYDATDLTGTITPGGAPLPVTLSTPGQNASLSFAGTAGQQVTVQMTGRTFTDMGLALSKPDGNLLCYIFSPRDGESLGPCTLPVNGTYTLVVDPHGNYTGGVTLNGYDAVLDYTRRRDCVICAPYSASVGRPVNVVGGNDLVVQRDFALPGRGLPLDIVRSYNSADPTDVGFGVGWSHPYAANVRWETATTAVVRYPDGRVGRYTAGSGGAFNAPPGSFDALVKNVDGTYTLTTPGQVSFDFDTDGRLTGMKDRNGNATTLVYAAGGLTITDPGGRAIVLAYGTGLDSRHFVSLVESGSLARTVRYAYSAAGDLTQVTDVRGGVTAMTYDASHRLLTVTDPLNRMVEQNTYDTNGRVTQQRDARNNLTTFAYDTINRRTAITDARNNVTVYAYDASNRITSVTDPLGQTVSYTYDANYNRIALTDQRGYTTTYTYDSRGNMLTVTDPLVHTATFTYNAANDPLTTTDALNRQTSFGYDARGNLTAITDPLGKVTTFAYDSAGNLTQVTDANGISTSFGYDAFGNRTSITDALTHTTTMTYDVGGRMTSRTDPLAHTTTYGYNAANQVTSVTDPLGHTTTMTYDAAGNRTGIADALGHTATFAYDGNNNLVAVTDPLGRTATYAYDVANNRTRFTDATARSTNFSYDAANRLTIVTDAGNHGTTYTRDAAGNIIGVTDANGNRTTYTLDAAGRLTAVTNALNQTTSYGYNAANQLTGVTDANNHTTAYSYDGAGRPSGKTDPLGRAWTVAYDNTGKVASRADPNNHTINYTYDAANRLTGIGYFDGTGVTYAYDDASRRTSMADATGTTTYAYDDADRLISVTAPGTGSVSYSYDNANRRTGIVYPSLHAVTYGYDDADRLIAVTDWLNNSTTYDYDDAGRPLSIAYPSGVAGAYTYDAAGRLTGVSYTKGTTTLATINYTLDNVGNRAQVVEAGVPLSGTTSYGYDALNRLTSAVYPDASTAAWGYDNVGNRTSITLNGATTSATYDSANRLIAQGSTSYTYDNNGNRLTRTAGGVTTTYGYDPEDRLTSVTGVGAATYRYDGDGYRVGKTVVGVPPAVTTYSWDRTALGGLGVVAGDGVAEYVFGPAGLHERVSGSVPAPTVQYAHGDGLGSIRLVTDGSGNAVSAATYEPWGSPRAGSAALGDYGFTGEQTDAETGFMYLRARYLDPATGRFLTQDTYTGALSDPASQHLFSYGRNNPLRYTDPSGHNPLAFLAVPVAWGWVVAVVGTGVALSCLLNPSCRDAISTAVEWAATANQTCQQEVAARLRQLVVQRSSDASTNGGGNAGAGGQVPSQPAGTLDKKSTGFWTGQGIEAEAAKDDLFRRAGGLLDLYLDDERNVWVKRKGAPDSAAEYVGTMEEVKQWYPRGDYGDRDRRHR